MKKYVVFLISFAVLLLLFELSSGLILTALYTPTTMSPMSNEAVAGSSSIFTIGIFLTGTIAYFIAQKSNKAPQVQTKNKSASA